MQQEHLLDIYTDYLISQNHHATATGLSAVLDHQISHDQITRFLNKSEFSSKDLWLRMKKHVHQHENKDEGVLIIDDTIEEKPYTDENKIVCWHYAHSKNCQVKGINILSCLVGYGDLALPISFEIIQKDEEYIDRLGKKRRRSSISKNKLFREMLGQAAKNQVKFGYVLADSWFASKENMVYIERVLGRKFIFGLKTNRLVALIDQEGKTGKYQDLESLHLKDNEKKVVFLKDVPFAVAIVKKEFTNEDQSKGTLYLVSNEVEQEGDMLFSIYQRRWRVEEYHKSIKENASLAKSPTKVVQSQSNHIFAAIISYTKLELLKVTTCLNHFALKYKLILKANQVAFLELQAIKSKLELCVT